ncbi:CDP-alcohol phosphatidyltransferase family protein, partial [Patescibacteria group bacterium]|nr:CDP-alcohol phosphatidyltransferase family protein [Patescibacteria group bacterium]
FIYFVPKDPIVAIYFLLAHVLIDAFDGPLSRLRKEDSDGGAFTDIMCDHTGMVIVVATLAYFSLVDPIISIAYVYLYTVMIIFVIVLNRVKVPLRLVFRTKYYVYILYAVWAIWGINYLDEGLLIFIVLMLPSVVGGFISLRKYLS